MIDEGFPESAVGYAAPAELESPGHSIAHRPVIAPVELGDLRDTLLPKFLTGELRVMRRENFVDAQA